MRFLALATDYDGTLAADGVVPDDAWQALRRLRESGRKLILVTGRELDDLRAICSPLDRFDRVVAENGGILYTPSRDEQRLLAPAPPREFVQALRDRGVVHLGVGATLVSTVKPYETAALEAIRDLGLELRVVFNKDAVMIASPGVTKASGLAAALEDLRLSPHNVVGIGDAENDHAFLDKCECSAAVDNALPMVKKHADFVTAGKESRGVIELVEELLADDLCRRDTCLSRHHLLLGRRVNPPEEEIRFSPYGTVALVSGPSGGGKSTATTGLLERLAGAGYQLCVFDPEGDYEGFEKAVVLGDAQHTPSSDEVLQLLRQPHQNVIVNLLRVPLVERPLFCAELLPHLQALRVQTGRPHWLVFDEAHHLFPATWDPAKVSLPQQLETAMLITVHPAQVSPAMLRHVNLALAVGTEPQQTLAELARAIDQAYPGEKAEELAKGQALLWRPGVPSPLAPCVVAVEPGHTQRRRHTRKYAEGLLIPERSFYFRGPEGKLNLRAHNLVIFLEMADGVDEDTWLHHLHLGDYSRWFGEVIGDNDLAGEAAQIEAQPNISVAESRRQMRAAIERRYTQPENPSLPKLGPPGAA